MKHNNDSKKNARRAILKSMAMGSGAIATGKMMPEKWARPVIDSVVLPAHAITSNIQLLSGLYNGPATFASLQTPGANGVLLAENAGYAEYILDFFVPKSHASHNISDFCAAVPAITIFVDQNTNTVDICIAFADSTPSHIHQIQAQTTVSGNNIADAIQISMEGTGAIDSGNDEFCDLTNMTMGAGNTISGNIRGYMLGSQAGNVECSTGFTATFVGGSFSCTPDHPGTGA